MDFTKIIWKIFKMNRNDFNKADRDIEKILIDVYNKGRIAGIKEEKQHIRSMLK
jgi:hypothetical protein